jgi:hypothetical protein
MLVNVSRKDTALVVWRRIFFFSVLFDWDSAQVEIKLYDEAELPKYCGLREREKAHRSAFPDGSWRFCAGLPA